ncbi:zinc finger protein 665-like [Hyalella azteca]|uniref:Zinc finger protein 665-like n=1 Tax=Hyalella azteca TaxID=294128 RepID=A0A8B7N073_HYAAZ|nr:zinc finger protein 665-like [Hyalella azteca]
MNCPVGKINANMGADDDISQHSTGTVKTEPLFEHNSTIPKREKLEVSEVEERDLFSTDDLKGYDAYNNIAVEEEPPRQDAPLVPDFQQPMPHGGGEHQETGPSLLNKNAESKGPALRSRLRPRAVVMTAAGNSGDRGTTTSSTRRTRSQRNSARRIQTQRATGESSDSFMHLRLRTRKSNSSTELLENSLKTLEKKQYVCAKCKHAYCGKKPLKRHERVQYVCSKCKNTFCGKMALNRHEKIIHLKLKTYKCSTCNRVYTRKDHLTRHVSFGQCHSFEAAVQLKSFSRK